MKTLLVPGKSAMALTQNQWNWITAGDPNGEFQGRFWDFYFTKKLILFSKSDNQPIAIFSVFVTEKDDSLSQRKELITKTIKKLLRMYQRRISGNCITPDMGFSLWFLKPALEEIKIDSEEELLEKFPYLRLRQYVILVNDFESGIEIDAPDRLIEPEIVT